MSAVRIDLTLMVCAQATHFSGLKLLEEQLNRPGGSSPFDIKSKIETAE